MTFTDFLRDRVGQNWVLHRRTTRIVRRYGDNVVCLSQKQYSDFEREYERLTMRSAHGTGPAQSLVDAAPDLLAAAQSARLMLHAWRGARRASGLADDHEELNSAIAELDGAIARARGDAA